MKVLQQVKTRVKWEMLLSSAICFTLIFFFLGKRTYWLQLAGGSSHCLITAPLSLSPCPLQSACPDTDPDTTALGISACPGTLRLTRRKQVPTAGPGRAAPARQAAREKQGHGCCCSQRRRECDFSLAPGACSWQGCVPPWHAVVSIPKFWLPQECALQIFFFWPGILLMGVGSMRKNCF